MRMVGKLKARDAPHAPPHPPSPPPRLRWCARPAEHSSAALTRQMNKFPHMSPATHCYKTGDQLLNPPPAAAKAAVERVEGCALLAVSCVLRWTRCTSVLSFFCPQSAGVGQEASSLCMRGNNTEAGAPDPRAVSLWPLPAAASFGHRVERLLRTTLTLM